MMRTIPLTPGQTFRHTHRSLNPNEAVPGRPSLLEQIQACSQEAERQKCSLDSDDSSDLIDEDDFDDEV